MLQLPTLLQITLTLQCIMPCTLPTKTSETKLKPVPLNQAHHLKQLMCYHPTWVVSYPRLHLKPQLTQLLIHLLDQKPDKLFQLHNQKPLNYINLHLNHLLLTKQPLPLKPSPLMYSCLMHQKLKLFPPTTLWSQKSTLLLINHLHLLSSLTKFIHLLLSPTQTSKVCVIPSIMISENCMKPEDTSIMCLLMLRNGISCKNSLLRHLKICRKS